jgi:hypothetical protein
MVKQRFLTHFKPWLFAVIKVGGLIVGYQLFDRIRTYFQYVPLNTMDVVRVSTVALLVIAMVCGLWAWGEWCWFKLRRFRGFCGDLKRSFDKHGRPRTVGAATGRMV